VLSPRTLIRVYVHTASRPDRKHAMGDEIGRAPIAFSFCFSFLFSFSFSVFVFLLCPFFNGGFILVSDYVRM